MTTYKGCPHHDAVFEIGPEDDWPLRAHLLEVHSDATGRIDPRSRSRPADPDGVERPPSDRPVEALCRRSLASEDAERAAGWRSPSSVAEGCPTRPSPTGSTSTRTSSAGSARRSPLRRGRRGRSDVRTGRPSGPEGYGGGRIGSDLALSTATGRSDIVRRSSAARPVHVHSDGERRIDGPLGRDRRRQAAVTRSDHSSGSGLPAPGAVGA